MAIAVWLLLLALVARCSWRLARNPRDAASGDARRSWWRLATAFLATSLLAVPLAVLLARIAFKHTERNAVEQIRRLGGDVVYNWPVHGPPPGPETLRRILGFDFFGHVDEVTLRRIGHLQDSEIRRLPVFSRLRFLNLEHSSVTDEGLLNLVDCSKLQGLFVHGTRVTQRGAVRLRQYLPNCEISFEPEWPWYD
jgi:hypothetical protein